MSKVSEAIYSLRKAMEEEEVNPIEGLPLDLFEFNTTLLPFINVDLFILNEKDQVLLSWRDDIHYGKGWHIPGGIIRMMETIGERIQKTALDEIGCEVIYDKKPIVVHENIISGYRTGLQFQLERAHNISLMYKCKVPDGYLIENKNRNEMESGYLRWFNRFPEDLLECHQSLKSYGIFEKWF